MENRSHALLRLSQFVHRYFLWVLIGAYAVAAVLPAPGLWIRDIRLGDISVLKTTMHVSLLLILLAALMFNAGLGVKTAHLRAVVRNTWVLAAGLAANILVPIVSIFAITTLVLNFWHNPQESQHILVGLALVAAMPIAGASTAWAQNSNGNLALSLGLVLSSTLLSPLVTPMVFYVLGELASNEYERVLHDLADYSSAAFLGLWVVLPQLHHLTDVELLECVGLASQGRRGARSRFSGDHVEHHDCPVCGRVFSGLWVERSVQLGRGRAGVAHGRAGHEQQRHGSGAGFAGPRFISSHHGPHHFL
jgi:hypothetical protein